MKWVRLFNPIRHLRLEREVAALPGQKRAIKSLVESIGRQAPAGSETEMRAALVILDGRVHSLETSAGLALNYLQHGRTNAAADVLSAVLSSMPVDQREAI